MVLKQKILLLLLFAGAVSYVNAQNKFAIVELFTSQGCSSCPAADKNLSRIQTDAIKNNKNIICLSYHVDYWNRLGWRDPFSKNQFTMRQENYSRILPGGEIYTPQMIVNGTTHFTGSDNKKADLEINNALTKNSLVEIKFISEKINNDTLVLNYSISKVDKNYVLRFALTESNLTTQVKRGENSGLLLTHDAVVRTFFSKSNSNLLDTVLIPLKDIKVGGKYELVCFIQLQSTMQIVAAVKQAFIY